MCRNAIPVVLAAPVQMIICAKMVFAILPLVVTESLARMNLKSVIKEHVGKNVARMNCLVPPTLHAQHREHANIVKLIRVVWRVVQRNLAVAGICAFRALVRLENPTASRKIVL